MKTKFSLYKHQKNYSTYMHYMYKYSFSLIKVQIVKDMQINYKTTQI